MTRRISPLCTIAAATLFGLLVATPASIAKAAMPTSSCVACHTDAGKLKAEAATIPIPTGSALQAGKG